MLGRTNTTTQCLHSQPIDRPANGNTRLCSHVKARWAERDLVVFVDNCYGEFVEDREPCHVGADLIAGSLIKNPGGTMAKSGEQVLLYSGGISGSVPGAGCFCCLLSTFWPTRV